MKVDQQTLSDLGFLPGGDDGEDLVAFLDRTRSVQGRRALGRRLTTPLPDPEAVKEVQEALSFLQQPPGIGGLLLHDGQVSAVQRYLDLNHAILPDRPFPLEGLEGEWVHFRDSDHVEQVVRGLDILKILLGSARRLAHALQGAPALLAGEKARLDGFLTGPGGTRLGAALDHGVGRVETLRLDRLARGTLRAELKGVLEVLSELDALVSMASVATELGFSRPEFVGGGPALEMDGVWHPLVRDPVRNDLHLANGTRLAFLTGPNMAGKSTFLKAVGVAFLLAHCGMGVPARSLRLSFGARLISSVRTRDSITQGVSFFQAEARRVRAILDSLHQERACLVLMDEPFQGTNIKDAREATQLLLAGFHQARASCFLVASHLTEVAPFVEALPSSRLLHFDAEVEGGMLEFSFRLKPGVSQQALGVAVLRDEGVLDALARLHSEERE